MNKDEILTKSRNENNTEYEMQLTNKVLSKSAIVLSGICILIFISKLIVSDLRGLEVPLPVYEPLALLSAYDASICLYLSAKSKSMMHLAFGSVFAGACFYFLYQFFITI